MFPGSPTYLVNHCYLLPPEMNEANSGSTKWCVGQVLHRWFVRRFLVEKSDPLQRVSLHWRTKSPPLDTTTSGIEHGRRLLERARLRPPTSYLHEFERPKSSRCCPEKQTATFENPTKYSTNLRSLTQATREPKHIHRVPVRKKIAIFGGRERGKLAGRIGMMNVNDKC